MLSHPNNVGPLYLSADMRQVLEIGTYIGFSTMGWAEAVGPNGHVTGLEFSPEYAQIARESFTKYGVTNTEIIVGDARESCVTRHVYSSQADRLFRIKSLAAAVTEPYDLIFIDADKTSYPTYLSMILEYSPKGPNSSRILRPGGIILADNILRHGLVADRTPANPWYAKQNGQSTWRPGDMESLDTFNKNLVNNERLEAFLMPMFDGLGMARLVD